MNKITYQKQKGRAIDTAIEWQKKAAESDYSYEEHAAAYNYFSKLAKRYGLIREFKENGII